MSPAAGAAKTVLIADDTAFVRDRFKAALEEAGHRAITVRTATELLARLRTDLERIDLVLLDLRLPHTSGPDARARGAEDSTKDACRSWSSAGRSPMPARSAIWQRSASPGTSTSTAPDRTCCPALAPHLFPDSFNRRGSPRVTLGIPISYRFGNTIAAALTLTLSRGGVAIRTTTPLESDAKVRLRLRLPGGTTDMDIDARVAWTDRRVGMGLQFERVAPADQQAINEFVDAHFFTNRRA